MLECNSSLGKRSEFHSQNHLPVKISIPKHSGNCYFFFNLFFPLVNFWLCWVFVAVLERLVAVASLVAEHWLSSGGTRA